MIIMKYRPTDHDTMGQDASCAGRTAPTKWSLTIVMLCALAMADFVDGRRRAKVTHPHGTQAPPSLTHAEKGTHVTKRMYTHVRDTYIDKNPIRIQPPAAKGAHGLSIITLRITSWNSKIFRYIESLDFDVIFIQEHRKLMKKHIKIPKGIAWH